MNSAYKRHKHYLQHCIGDSSYRCRNGELVRVSCPVMRRCPCPHRGSGKIQHKRVLHRKLTGSPLISAKATAGNHTWRDCSSDNSSEAFIPFSVISLVNLVSAQDPLAGRLRDSPGNHPTAPFPILASFESCIASYQFLEHWV